MAKDEILRRASQKLGEVLADRKKSPLLAEKERKEKAQKDLVENLSKDVVNLISPLILGLVAQSKQDSDKLVEAIKSIQITTPPISFPEINIPEIKLPHISVPESNVVVHVPEIKIPQIPEQKIVMPDFMNVSMSGVDNLKPLPVIMMDSKGRPQSFSQGASGGKADFFTIKNIITSTGASLISDAGFLKVEGNLSVVGSSSSTLVQLANADGTYYDSANPLPVTGSFSSTPYGTYYASDAVGSVNVVQTAGLTNTELRATQVQTQQVSGYSDSVNVVSTVGLTDTQLRASGVQVQQVSGASDSVNVISTVGLTDTQLRATQVQVQQVSGASDSVNVVSTIGLTDTQLRTTAVPVSQVSGASWSTSVVNTPTVRPIQVRGSLATAYATLSTGTETTLLAGVAGTYLDMVSILGANQSNVAVSVDIRMVTGGNVVMTLAIPANSTAGINQSVPYPQSDTGNSWTADMSDITGTTVNLTALFSKE